MVDVKGKHKIMVMAILAGICCVLTHYFHAVRETGVVFTHAFYIPTILSIAVVAFGSCLIFNGVAIFQLFFW